MAIEKYKELYALSNTLLKDETDRFNRVDQKAAHYLSVITLLIGIEGALAKDILKSLIPTATFLQWLLLNVGIVSFFMILATWFVIFRTIRMQGLLVPPLNQEMLDFFKDQKEINIYYHLAKANADAREENIRITDRKCKSLVYGYRMIIATVCTFVLFISLFFAQSWNNSPSMRGDMKEQQPTENKGSNTIKGTSNPSPEPQKQPPQELAPKATLEPNLNVKAPMYITLANEKSKRPSKL